MSVTADAGKRRRKAPAIARDWTKGPVVRNLLLLSWPMVMMEGLWVISQLTDMIWVGRLGSQAIAGIGIANIFLMLIYSVDMGLIVGVRAMVARYVGAGDIKGANHITAQAIIVAASWGLLVTLIGAFLARPLLSLFGADAAVLAEGAAFMQTMLLGWLSFEILVVGLYAIQAAGDTVTPMIIEAIMRALHIALCPFLVLGLWIFPELGVRGAAISAIAGQVLGTVIILYLLLSDRNRLQVRVRDFRPVPRTMLRLLKIGIPALVMNLQGAIGSNLLMKLIIPFGTIGVAAHSLTSRVEMFLFVPGMGLGAGAGVLAGQNLGAGQPKRAAKTSWAAVGVVQAFMIACSLVILIWAEAIVGLFSSDTSVVELGSMLLRISTTAYLLNSLSQVLQNSIGGAGDTVPIMIVSIAATWVIQLPLAFLLTRMTDLGIIGIRWAMVASLIAASFAYLGYFLSGKWKSKRI